MATYLVETLRRLKRKLPASSAHRQPREAILMVDSPRPDSVVTGLLPITGWGFTATAQGPEGIVEVALDDEHHWAELTLRMGVGGVDAAARWANRCGFQAALNTFLLSNGDHRIRLRLKDRAGRVLFERAVPVRVDNVGRLAETTARLLHAYPHAKRIWTGLIDSSDFPYAEATGIAWFDRPDALDQVPEIISRHGLDGRYDAHLRHFIDEGYIVIDDFVARAWCEEINRDLDSAIRSGALHYGQDGKRVEHLFEHSKATRDLWAHPEILKILSAIYDDVALPCQTLNFIHGSQQDAHQDLIHLTPFPAGMMCGVWVALEDVHPDSGPLVVYPKSHRLPRLYTRTVPVDKVRDNNWAEFVASYSPRLMSLIEQAGLEPFYYTPKAGSVLIWHEALAHGGSRRKNNQLTRKSMVSHYFARGAIAYYDSTGMPGWTHDD